MLDLFNAIKNQNEMYSVENLSFRFSLCSEARSILLDAFDLYTPLLPSTRQLIYTTSSFSHPDIARCNRIDAYFDNSHGFSFPLLLLYLSPSRFEIILILHMWSQVAREERRGKPAKDGLKEEVGCTFPNPQAKFFSRFARERRFAGTRGRTSETPVLYF